MLQKRSTIALFAAPLDATLYFQTWQIWAGAARAARLRNVDLLYIAGGEARRNPRGMLYDLVDAETVLGIVSWNGVVTPWQVDEVSAFLGRFRPLPIVNIGFTAPGIPSLVFDQAAGVGAAVTHLAEVHGFRRIVFLTASAPHPGMAAGLTGYRETLRRLGNLDLELVVEAPLDAGLSALDDRGLRPGLDYDAVVCSLDSLAMQVIEELQIRGVHVPGEVAVTGLHDGQEARLTTPSLTTLRMPWEESGAQAVEMALNLMSGQAVPEATALSLQLIVRRSCGCLDARTSAAAVGCHVGESRLVSLPAEVRQEALAAMTSAVGRTAANMVPDWSESLLDSFLADLEDEPRQNSAPAPPRTVLVLEELLRLTATGSGSVAAWHDVSSAMRRTLLPHIGDARNEDRTAAENLWQQARFAVGQAITRQEARRAWQTMQRTQVIQDLDTALHVAPNQAEVLEILARSLPRLGIARCNVAIFDDPTRPATGARLVLAYENGRSAPLPEGGKPLGLSVLRNVIHLMAGGPAEAHEGNHADSLTSATIQAQSASLLVETLYFGDEILGIVVFEADPMDGPGKSSVYEALRSQLSSALMGARLRAETEAARRQAEEANQLKSRFLSMVSHELRTPLAQIVGLTEMASLRATRRNNRSADLAKTLLGYHRQIHASAQHLDRLIRDVLDLASEHVGQLRLECEPLDILRLLADTAAIGEQIAADKGLGWRCELPPLLPPVAGDRTRLQQVLLNLLANAAKFTSRGEISLRAVARDHAIIVEVSDTGPGVPVSEQQAIFNEFYQAPGAGTQATRGLGLGLAVSRLLVEQHGGTIGVRSTGKEGAGSTFYFSLPELASEVESCAASPAPEHPATGPVLILSIDDDTQGVLRRRLEAQGFEVARLQFSAGEDPLPAVLALRPGAVLLECSADVEWGWQVIRKLKEYPSGRAIPVIFYALAEAEDRGGILAVDILVKPAGTADLVAAVARYGLRPGIGQPAQTILVVDDDLDTLTIHAGLLRAQLPGSRVLTAPGGRATLELLRHEVPSLVVLDLLMPEIDGFAVLETLRADPRTRHVPVIVLTGRALTEADMSRLAGGAAAVLSKGVFTVQETMTRIQAVLANMPGCGTEGQRQVRRAVAYIHANYAEPISRRGIAGHLGLHMDSLSRYFSEEMGVSIVTFLNRYRLVQACKLLESTHQSITEIAGEVGFESHSYFTRTFSRDIGVTPTEYRQGQRRAGR